MVLVPAILLETLWRYFVFPSPHLPQHKQQNNIRNLNSLRSAGHRDYILQYIYISRDIFFVIAHLTLHENVIKTTVGF